MVINKIDWIPYSNLKGWPTKKDYQEKTCTFHWINEEIDQRLTLLPLNWLMIPGTLHPSGSIAPRTSSNSRVSISRSETQIGNMSSPSSDLRPLHIHKCHSLNAKQISFILMQRAFQSLFNLGIIKFEKLLKALAEIKLKDSLGTDFVRVMTNYILSVHISNILNWIVLRLDRKSRP